MKTGMLMMIFGVCLIAGETLSFAKIRPSGSARYEECVDFLKRRVPTAREGCAMAVTQGPPWHHMGAALL